MDTLNIARMTFLEARMRKMLWAVILLGAAFLIVYTIGFYFMYREISQAVSSSLARRRHFPKQNQSSQ